MQSHLEALFDEADQRYIQAEEFGLINQYVSSIPARLKTYRLLRDQELPLMQKVADQLQETLPNETVENLERSIKNGVLVLRYCAMAMLLNEESFVKDRLSGWLSEPMQGQDNQIIATFHRLLTQTLNELLAAEQQELLKPMLTLATHMLDRAEPETATEDLLTAAGLF